MAAEYVAWLNGEYIPLSQASLSVLDAGVTTGASVTERLRTFRHAPFLLDKHLERFSRSADAAFVPLRLPANRIDALVHTTVEKNSALISKDDDLAISIFATAGTSAGPSLCIHATRIAASAEYAPYYEAGLRLAVPSTRAIPIDSLSPQIKTRSRLHWHIADRQASQAESGAKALLVDHNGYVTETAAGNVFVVSGNRLLTPRRSNTLRGISQQHVMELAGKLGIACSEADLYVGDVQSADEVFTSSSVYCLLPVVRLNQSIIGDGRPGPVHRQLLASWSKAVGVEIAEQMRRMAS